MDKYLQQILNEVNTIIIPGLGALTLTNKTTGDIMFMGFLKHDDGNLSKYIAEKENIPDNEAKNLIAKHVREILAKLDSGDTYDMYQFGRFIKKNGEIEFENWNNYQHDAAAATTAVPITEEKPLELVEEPKLEVIPEPVAEPEPVVTPEPVVEKAPEPIVEKTPTVSAAAPAEGMDRQEAPKAEEVKKVEEPKKAEEPKIDVSAIKPDENVYISETELKDLEKKQATQTPDKTEAPKPAAKTDSKAKAAQAPKAAPTQSKEKKKRSSLFWAAIIVGIIVVLAGAGTAIFYKEVKEFINGKTEETKPMLTEENKKASEELAKEQETIEEQVALEQEPVSENPEEVTPPVEESQPTKTMPAAGKEEKQSPKSNPAPSGSGGSYHIIAGGFASEANANRFAEKLQSEGKASSVLGKFDDLYLVSYESFSSQEEASSALKSASIKGWIFKYPK